MLNYLEKKFDAHANPNPKNNPNYKPNSNPFI